MSNLVRYLHHDVFQDLQRKMVLIGGPRQVGKTTFATSFLKPPGIENPGYLNWDNLDDKKIIKTGEVPDQSPLIVFDEIHKYKHWRNLIKGLYDKKRNRHQFLITGSAKIEHYSKGGDSLLGRYHLYRMHPLSISELQIKSNDQLQDLLTFGGFPEPFYMQNTTFAKRWRKERHRRIIHEDLKDLENLKEISLIEDTFDLISKYVSSQLVYQSIAQQVEVDIKTIQNWIRIFDNLYLTFRIQPYIPKQFRVVKRTERIYFWDWSYLEDPGARFENLVASQLLKYCHFIEDTQGEIMELKYLRDVDGREIDFIVLKNKKPIFAVECKTNDRATSPHLFYYRERLQIPHYYQVHMGKEHHRPEENIEVIPFIEFCKKLDLP